MCVPAAHDEHIPTYTDDRWSWLEISGISNVVAIYTRIILSRRAWKKKIE